MRNYLAVKSSEGWPHYAGLFYECLKCGDILDGASGKSAACSCWNIVFDGDAGRTVIEDETKVKLFENK